MPREVIASFTSSSVSAFPPLCVAKSLASLRISSIRAKGIISVWLHINRFSYNSALQAVDRQLGDPILLPQTLLKVLPQVVQEQSLVNFPFFHTILTIFN